MFAQVLTEKRLDECQGLIEHEDDFRRLAAPIRDCRTLLGRSHSHFFEPLKPNPGRAIKEAGKTVAAIRTKTRTGGVPTTGRWGPRRHTLWQIS